MLILTQAQVDEIVAHCKAQMPYEACGVVAGRDDAATQVFTMTNAERSPILYRMEPAEQLRVFRAIEEQNLEMLAIYHSHTRSPAYPSDTDVRLAFYEDSVYLIVSMSEEQGPQLRGYYIKDCRQISEVPLKIVD